MRRPPTVTATVGALLLSGPGSPDRTIPLSEGASVIVGREAPSTVVIADAGVSRQHLRIDCAGGLVLASDLGSRNGTRLNGQPLHGQRPLRPGDVLIVGPYRLLARPADSGGTAIVRVRGQRRGGVVLASFAGIAAAVALAAGGVYLWQQREGDPPATVAGAAVSAPLSESQQITEAVRTVRPAVVRIRTRTAEGAGVGTGIIIEDGVVVTNAHVVEGDPAPTVTLADGSEVRGQVTGSDDRVDLAVIRLPRTGLPVARWGDSNALQPGERLVAIGYALGASAFTSGEPTVTSGIFSGRREFRGQAYVQTDTPLNHGNSGGPLINLRGEVIGVNVLVIGRTPEQQAQGLNLAIPATVAQPLVPTLRDRPIAREPAPSATATARPSGGPPASPTPGARPATATPAAARAPAGAYRNATHGYALSYPSAWRLDEGDPNSVVLMAGNGAGIVIDVESDLRVGTLAEYTDRLIALSRRSMTNFEVTNRATRRLASGVEVTALRVRWTENGRDYEAIEYIALDGRKGYDITGLAPASRFAEMQGQLEGVMNTFSPR